MPKIEKNRDEKNIMSQFRDDGISHSRSFPLQFPYRYGDIGDKLVTIEPTVYHDTAERRDERGGIVLTGDLQDDLQVAHDDDNDDDNVVHLRRLAIRSDQGS